LSKIKRKERYVEDQKELFSSRKIQEL